MFWFTAKLAAFDVTEMVVEDPPVKLEILVVFEVLVLAAMFGTLV